MKYYFIPSNKTTVRSTGGGAIIGVISCRFLITEDTYDINNPDASLVISDSSFTSRQNIENTSFYQDALADLTAKAQRKWDETDAVIDYILYYSGKPDLAGIDADISGLAIDTTSTDIVNDEPTMWDRIVSFFT